MQKLISLFIVVAASAAVVGCSKDSKPSNDGPVRTYFVKGDPDELIAGSQRVTQNSLTDANFRIWNSYKLLTVAQFVEKSEVVKDPTTKEELEKKNKASDGTETRPEEAFQISVSQVRSGYWKMSLLKNSVVIDFQQDRQGNLQPTSISMAGARYPLEIVHWSRAEERGYVSFLVRMQDPQQGKNLIALYFEPKDSVVAIPKVNPKYRFLAGPGVQIGWKTGKRPLEITLCGRGPSEKVSYAVSKWKTVLGNRLPLQYAQTNTYYPFSDLNQHCVYFIYSYISIESKASANYGATLTPLSSQQAEIYDSDVFMYESEFRKHGYDANSPMLADEMEITLVHELGHLLGLAHQFDGTKSVMSYAFDSKLPQSYDIEAITALYPETPRVAPRKK